MMKAVILFTSCLENIWAWSMDISKYSRYSRVLTETCTLHKSWLKSANTYTQISEQNQCLFSEARRYVNGHIMLLIFLHTSCYLEACKNKFLFPSFPAKSQLCHFGTGPKHMKRTTATTALENKKAWYRLREWLSFIIYNKKILV